MSDQTVYRVTFSDGSSCHYGVESLARAAARKTGKVEAISLFGMPVHAPAHDVRTEPYIDIDERYAGRLAILLECMLIDPNGYWNEAASLLDEYKAEWDRVNPPLPTFMGDPMPPERKVILMAMKAKREACNAAPSIQDTDKGEKE